MKKNCKIKTIFGNLEVIDIELESKPDNYILFTGISKKRGSKNDFLYIHKDDLKEIIKKAVNLF